MTLLLTKAARRARRRGHDHPAKPYQCLFSNPGWCWLCCGTSLEPQEAVLVASDDSLQRFGEHEYSTDNGKDVITETPKGSITKLEWPDFYPRTVKMH